MTALEVTLLVLASCCTTAVVAGSAYLIGFWTFAWAIPALWLTVYLGTRGAR